MTINKESRPCSKGFWLLCTHVVVTVVVIAVVIAVVIVVIIFVIIFVIIVVVIIFLLSHCCCCLKEASRLCLHYACAQVFFRSRMNNL